MAWAGALIGVWTIIAPWVVSGRVADTGARVSNVIAGALVVLMALATIAQGTMRGSSRTMSRTTLR
jgi:hypothetical protein